MPRGGEAPCQAPPCRSFAQGRCTWGRRCKFSHHGPGASVKKLPEDPEELSMVSADPTPGEVLDWEELHGGKDGLQKIYRLGHSFGHDGELYLELQGEFLLRLVVPASTKISAEDRTLWDSIPIDLAGQHFDSLNKLQTHVRKMLNEYLPGTRLRGEEDELLRALFAHHPRAPEKLFKLGFLQIGKNPYDAKQNAFWLMRSEKEGEDISYVKCLRALADSHSLEAETRTTTAREERVAVLVSVRSGKSLEVKLGELHRTLDKPPESVGLHVRLQERTASVRIANWLGCSELGPKTLKLGRRQNRELMVFPVVDVPPDGKATVRLAPPFALPAPQGEEELREPAELAEDSEARGEGPQERQLEHGELGEAGAALAQEVQPATSSLTPRPVGLLPSGQAASLRPAWTSSPAHPPVDDGRDA